MKLKSTYFTMAAFVAIATASAPANAQNDLIYLDLSKATTPLTFNETNGRWTDTYNDDETEIESQVFSIVHESMEDYNTWWGFTASNSVDNKYQSNTLIYQYSNMALGGILLDENGNIKKTSFGAPETGKEMPYLVGFAGFGKSEITFNTGKLYEVVGAYVNLNSYTFYSLLYGDGFARAFTQGDELTLVIHGVDAEEIEKTVEVSMASFNNGDLTAAKGWKYVDLTPLGVVEEIYFTMKSTDSGQYGMNTPAYFCLDKLAVKEVSTVNVDSLNPESGNIQITYDRGAKTINLGKETFAAVYNSAGQMVKSGETSSISITDLPAGIYVVKAGNSRLKFAR